MGGLYHSKLVESEAFAASLLDACTSGAGEAKSSDRKFGDFETAASRGYYAFGNRVFGNIHAPNIISHSAHHDDRLARKVFRPIRMGSNSLDSGDRQRRSCNREEQNCVSS